jgi:CubicO group peptidase (beta-lactamase class C family)
MNSQLTLLRLRTVAMMTTIAAGLLVGCNASSLADQRADALDKAIPAAMKRASVPGAIVGIWQDGREPYVRAFGVRDTATRQPMATDLYMRIGSNSKTFTVTAILMLADQGKLRLDDPIDRFVEGVPSGNQITSGSSRQCAAGGLYDYSGDTNPKLPQQPFRQWTPRKLLEISFHYPLLFPPGSDFDYSNTNTVLLGVVVEKVSGQSLASFIEQNILKPEGDPHGVPGGSGVPLAACSRLLQTAGWHGRRRDGLESVMGLGFGQYDFDARRHARVGARPRHRQVAVARHEARARPVLARAPGRRGRAVRASDREPERLDRPQRQYHELHGLPLPPPGRGDHDGGAVELGRRHPGVVDNDARHHPDHQP